MWHDVKLLNATTNTLLGLLLLALLGSGAWWLAQRPMFTLKVIRIEGAGGEPLRHVNAATIRNAALPHIRGNFFTADLDAVRAAFESVPWVRRASVRREWPNKLVVTLDEHVALGTWGQDGQLLSARGDVFTANLAEAEEDRQLLAFAGPQGSAQEVEQRYRDLKRWFAPVGVKPEAVTLSGRYAWSVKLDNGIVVELGREQNPSMLQDRVARLVSVYPKLMERLQNRIESVDMRYPNGLALKAEGLALGNKGKK